MNHYVDIELRPDPEFVANHLMSALYAKLHRALAAQASPAIATPTPAAAVGRTRARRTSPIQAKN